MSKATKNLIVSAALAIFILIVLFGCGKRTTSFDRIEIKKDSLVINKSIELNQNITWSDIGTLTPIDNSKPMILNGVHYYNSLITFDKSIKKGIEIKGNENLSYKGSETEDVKKDTEKKDSSNLWIGLSLIIGILFVLYLTLKKYKIL